jgi:putative tricarboxylic transport membrane protein
MRDRGEVCFNAAIFLGSILLFQVSRSFPRFQSADMIGPSAYPQWLLAMTALLTGVLLIRNIRELLKQRGKVSVPSAQGGTALNTLLWVMFISVAYAFIVEYTGFILSIIVYQVLLLYILKVRSPWTLTLYPLGQTAVFYLVFMQLLKIPFPRGEGIFLYFSRLFY